MLRNIIMPIADNILIMPLNSEIIILDNENIKKNIICYIVFSVIGSVIAYCIGYYRYKEVEFIVEYILTIATHKPLNIDVLQKCLCVNRLAQTILLKSFIPMLPITIINLMCGYNKVNILHFIVLMTMMRTIRALFILLMKKILRKNIILEVITNMLKVITISIIFNVFSITIYKHCLYI